MEPTEIQEFSEHMKESGEKGESLTNISLAISILAVLVAMVTVMGHRTHTEAVLMQSRAGDKWNQYQAKNIRSSITSGISDLLALQPSSNAAGVEAKLKSYEHQQEKWRDDLAELQKTAHEYEGEVDLAERKASRFDLGEALLQIAVVMCSITLFTRNRLYFFLGLALGAGGLLIAAAAFFVY